MRQPTFKVYKNELGLPWLSYDKDALIKDVARIKRRPWWWLRLWGWSVRINPLAVAYLEEASRLVEEASHPVEEHLVARSGLASL